MIIANPIYEVVFRYLMKNERIARTLKNRAGNLNCKNWLTIELYPHCPSIMSEQSPQLLDIKENAFVGDDDMLYVIKHLLTASIDPIMRHNMNVEEEYFSVIEKRDTTILMKEKELAERNAQLKESEAQLKESEAQRKEQAILLRRSIEMFLKTGLSVEMIAQNMGMTTEQVEGILSN